MVRSRKVSVVIHSWEWCNCCGVNLTSLPNGSVGGYAFPIQFGPSWTLEGFAIAVDNCRRIVLLSMSCQEHKSRWSEEKSRCEKRSVCAKVEDFGDQHDRKMPNSFESRGKSIIRNSAGGNLARGQLHLSCSWLFSPWATSPQGVPTLSRAEEMSHIVHHHTI